MSNLEIILIFTLCTTVFSLQKFHGLDIIVRGYKALRLSEIRNFTSATYGFNFCSCETSSANPESDPKCRCAELQEGRTAEQSVPAAIFPLSCMYSAEKENCLKTSLSPFDSKNLLYVKISLGKVTVTLPEYQQIPATRRNHVVRLNCLSKPNTCLDCFHRKSGVIELTYAVKPRCKPYKNIANLLPEKKTLEAIKASVKQPLSVSVKKVESSMAFPKQDLSTIDGIKDYLLDKAMVSPKTKGTFNVTAFKNAVVEQHNKYREKHGANPLTHDNNIAVFAQQWANLLARKSSRIEHDPASRYGENIFFYAATMLPSEDALAEMTVHSFYIESKGYSYQTHNNLNYHSTGHFTQLVWKNTEKLGIGVAVKHCQKNSLIPNFASTAVYVVIKYDPPGNVLSLKHFNVNVLPPLSTDFSALEENTL